MGNFCRIPFLLIEDILEHKTIQKAESIWKIIESLIEKITQPDLFSKGFSPNIIYKLILRQVQEIYDYLAVEI